MIRIGDSLRDWSSSPALASNRCTLRTWPLRILLFLSIRKVSDSNVACSFDLTPAVRAKGFLTFPNLETLVLGDLSPSTSISFKGRTIDEGAGLRTQDVIRRLHSAIADRAHSGRRLKTLEFLLMWSDPTSEAYLRDNLCFVLGAYCWVDKVECCRAGFPEGAGTRWLCSLDEISDDAESEDA